MYNSILLLNNVLLGNNGKKEDFDKIHEILRVIERNNKALKKNQERIEEGKTKNKYLIDFEIENDDEIEM